MLKGCMSAEASGLFAPDSCPWRVPQGCRFSSKGSGVPVGVSPGGCRQRSGCATCRCGAPAFLSKWGSPGGSAHSRSSGEGRLPEGSERFSAPGPVPVVSGGSVSHLHSLQQLRIAIETELLVESSEPRGSLSNWDERAPSVQGFAQEEISVLALFPIPPTGL